MISISTASILTVAPDNAPVRQFLTPLPTPGHFLLVLDNSALEKWKRCAMAARNYLLLGREAHAKDAALVFGGAIHVGLEALLLGRDTSIIIEKVLRYFTENPTPLDEYRTVQCAIEVLYHYSQRALLPDYTMEVLSHDGVPLIERAFELPLGVIEVEQEISLPSGSIYVSHIHVAWSGRIDVIANCGPKMLPHVMDHKTAKYVDDKYCDGFRLSSQVLGYLWAGNQLWPELNLNLFCLDVIHLRKPAKGQGLRDKGPRGGEPPLNFMRFYFEYSKERLDQWKDDTLHHISDLIHCLTRKAWPMNDANCVNKYGLCPYHSVCSIDIIEVRERLILSDQFKPVTWNPTHERT